MNSPMVGIFGSVIAVVLLLLVSVSIFYMASEVMTLCANAGPCKPSFSDGLIYVVTTVGGLVSALVIAQLSVTEPGSAPSIGGFEPSSSVGILTTNTVIALYLLGWIATGLTALIVGVMLYPDASSTLSDIGTTWLGLAVSAAYAYFGIKPSMARSGAENTVPKTAADERAPGQKIPKNRGG